MTYYFIDQILLFLSIQAIASSAEAQLLQFTDQWKEYIEGFLHDSEESLSNNLSQLLQIHIQPLDESIKELHALKSRQELDHEQTSETVFADCQAFVNDCQAYQRQKREEKKSLKQDIENLKEKYYNVFAKEISSEIQQKQKTSSHLKDELLKQLDSI
jgi:hypothetical protein